MVRAVIPIGWMFIGALTLVSCDRAADRGDDRAPHSDSVPDLWAEVMAADFPGNWYKWPGREVERRSRPPHGPIVTTFMEFLAYDALSNGAVVMSDGATLVVANFRDGTERSYDVMRKSDGGWLFASYEQDGTPLPEGRYEQSCESCHSGSATDYIMTTPLGTAETMGGLGARRR